MAIQLIGYTLDGRRRFAADYILPPPALAGGGDPAINDQIDQSTDTGCQRESDGLMLIDSADRVTIRSWDVDTGRYWGAFRFRSPTGVDADPDEWPAKGSTVDVAHAELYAYDDPEHDLRCDVYCEDAAGPLTLNAGAFNITNRPLTAESEPWVEDALGVGWEQSPSLVDPIQEVVTAYNITALMLIFKPRSDLQKDLRVRNWDFDDNSWGAKLYLEWTVGGVGGGPIGGGGSIGPLGVIGGAEL